MTPPEGTWNQRFDFRQGGTFTGVTAQLDYFEALGVGALWLSPVVKNARPDNCAWNYHGYGAQNFIELDARFASDGTLATAEREFTELVDGAHARGIRIILDIVLNHAGPGLRLFARWPGRADFRGSGRYQRTAWAANPPSGGWTDLVRLAPTGQMSSPTVRRPLEMMLFIQLTCAGRTSSAAAAARSPTIPDRTASCAATSKTCAN